MTLKEKIRNSALAIGCVLLAVSGVALAAQLDGEETVWEHFSARHDRNADGLVTAEEFGQTDPRFQHLDGDGDGTVTPDEVQATVGSLGGPPTPGRGLAHLADRDQDGQVTAAEWSAEVAEIDSHFEALDTDGDGVISSDEMRGPWAGRGARFGRFHHRSPWAAGEHPAGFGPRSGYGPHGDFDGPAGPGRRHLLHADEDGDGAVTLDEWNFMLNKFDRQAIFDALDSDGDQVISSEEMSAARPR